MTAVYLGHPILESDPPERREGIARRRLLMTLGVCPCGVRMSDARRTVDRDGITHLRINHEDDCPAIDLGGTE